MTKKQANCTLGQVITEEYMLTSRHAVAKHAIAYTDFKSAHWLTSLASQHEGRALYSAESQQNGTPADAQKAPSQQSTISAPFV